MINDMIQALDDFGFYAQCKYSELEVLFDFFEDHGIERPTYIESGAGIYHVRVICPEDTFNKLIERYPEFCFGPKAPFTDSIYIHKTGEPYALG